VINARKYGILTSTPNSPPQSRPKNKREKYEVYNSDSCFVVYNRRSTRYITAILALLYITTSFRLLSSRGIKPLRVLIHQVGLAEKMEPVLSFLKKMRKNEG
jgi:hypothetical protein